MKQEFVLSGLACANCGNKIEAAAGKLSGVKQAGVNILTSTLTLETDRASAEITPEINEIVLRYEPDVKVIPKSAKIIKKEQKIPLNIIRLITGGVLLLCGFILPFSQYIKLIFFIISYAILGFDVLRKALRNLLRGQLFDENFLMGIATAGALIIGEAPEAAGVMLFYQIGEYFQDLAVGKSKKSITALLNIRPDYANIEANGQLTRVEPESVKVGDIITVRPGEKIPLDGRIISGESRLNTSALTGESVPRSVRAGDEALSGCINETGLLRIEVTKIFGESTASKIIEMVENAANKKSPTENFITAFAKFYTPIVVGLAAAIVIIPSLILGGWSGWLYRGLKFLVISCPCALVISIPMGYFGGIGNASKRGILIKGSNYLEALKRVDTVVFDKTGTLTKGVFSVTELNAADGFTRESLLEYSTLAESYSSHPIAQSILREHGNIDKSRIQNYEEISGFGISVTADEKKILAGNPRLMEMNGIQNQRTEKAGTAVHVAVNGVYAGNIVIADKIKPDSKKAVSRLKALGVKKVVMLTGDTARIAREIGSELGIDEIYPELLPEDKVVCLEEIAGEKDSKSKVAFVGDGINDAPVLARADIGVAMGALGSDAAIEAADIVLMTDEPSKLADAVQIARYTKKIVWQNIIFALGIKFIFLILAAFNIAGMWEAVFADVGVALLAIFNSTRILNHKF